MSLNLIFLDQIVQKTASDFLKELGGDKEKAISKAFIFQTVKSLLDIESDEDIFDCIYDGANDFGIDALYSSDIVDESFHIKIFQGKYKRLHRQNKEDYSGDAYFPANEVQKIVGAIKTIFDPTKTYSAHSRLEAKIEEIRSIMLNEGIIPSIEVVFCNNGNYLNKQGEEYIQNANFPNYVNFRHFNHDDFVSLSQARKVVDEHLVFSGYRIVEDFDRKRFFLGKVPVAEFYRVFDKHGDVLLEKNIRKYLGTKGNKVNASIAETRDIVISGV